MKTCNQCQQELTLGRIKIDATQRYHCYVCCNPECPNYGLLQIPREDMQLTEEKDANITRAIKKNVESKNKRRG